MFAYCNNNPVTYHDPTGYWGYTVNGDSDHKKMTTYYSLDSLISSILTKYGIAANATNISTAKTALLRGCVEPDENTMLLYGGKGKMWPADEGWHGVWNGAYKNGREINVRLEDGYFAAHYHMKFDKNIKTAFLWLGISLHTIQDMTSHFMYGIWGVGAHCSKGDSLQYDFVYAPHTVNGNGDIPWIWNKLKTTTVAGNRRARLAAVYSYYYLYYFHTAIGTNFKKYNYSTNGIINVMKTYK